MESEEHTLTGENAGHAWRAVYERLPRFAVKSIEVEHAPGHWIGLRAIGSKSWHTRGEMQDAIEERVERFFANDFPDAALDSPGF